MKCSIQNITQTFIFIFSAKHSGKNNCYLTNEIRQIPIFISRKRCVFTKRYIILSNKYYSLDLLFIYYFIAKQLIEMKNDKFKGREKGQREEEMLSIAVKKTKQYEIEIRLKSI